LKLIAVCLPGEPLWWFLYHYVVRLGFLEGRPGLIASQIRSSYIAQTRAKVHELAIVQRRQPNTTSVATPSVSSTAVQPTV
jgi:hypothetical protein